MNKAIELLEAKRAEWVARAEYHRQKGMDFHVKNDYDRRDEERQLGKLAIDNIHGLDYAIALLKGEN